jgi:alpha-mannosidase
VRDRQFWDGIDFWCAALDAWAVLAEHPIATWSAVRDDGTAGEATVHPETSWPWPDAVRIRLQVADRAPWDQPWLVVQADGEGVLRVNGTVWWGINPTHDRAPLPLRQGERADLDIQLGRLGRLGRFLADPRIRRIAWQERDALIDEAFWDLLVLREWATTPGTPPEVASLVADWVHAALEPLQNGPAEATAWRRWLEVRGGSPAEDVLYRRIVVAGEELAGLKPLPREERIARGHLVRDRLRGVMEQVARRWPKHAGHLVALGHAHIDVAWLWPFAETRRKVMGTVSTQLALLERYPEVTYGMSSPELWRMVEEDAPELAHRLKGFARAGRVEPLGPFWVEADAQMIGATAAIRHMVETVRYFQAATGHRVTTAFLPDTFGFSGGLPTLLVAGGFRLFLTTKLYWNDTTRFPYRDFWWVGPDGSRIQAHLFGLTPRGYNGTATVADVRDAYGAYAEGDGRDTLLYTVGWGDGGGGLAIGHIERMRRLEMLPAVPALTWGRAEELARHAAPDWPTVRGPLYLELHRGVFTTQTRVKSVNARVEDALLAVEAWQTWTGCDHLAMQDAWRRVLRNQFHDILPGSSIATVYADWRSDVLPVWSAAKQAVLAMVQDTTTPTEAGSLTVVHAAGMAAPARLLLVDAPTRFALANATRDEWVEAEPTYDGRWVVPVPAQPALSWARWPIRWEPAGPVANVGQPEELETVVLETAAGRLVWGPEGLTSWTVGGRELLAAPCGVRAYWNHPARSDAWELAPDYRTRPATLRHDRPRVLERNRWRTVVALSHATGESRIEEHWAVEPNGLMAVTITGTVPDRHLVIRFELPTTLVAPLAEAEALWGVDVVPTWPSTPAEQARYEWAAHRFVSLAEPRRGVALLNDGRYGHSVQGGTLGVTIATAPLYPDPDADRRFEPAHLVVQLHEGSWRDAGVLERGHALAAPTWAVWTASAEAEVAAPLMDLPPNVRVLRLAEASDGSGDWVATLGETFGEWTRVAFRIASHVADVSACQLVEETPREDAGVSWDAHRKQALVTLPPWTVKTMRIHRRA